MKRQNLPKPARLNSHRAPAGEKKSRLWRQRCAVIARQPFFKGLTAAQVQLLADCSLQMQFLPDQVVFREGQPANRFFLILSGKIALETKGPGGRLTRLQTLGAGDDLGWSWLFPPYKLHFSARALTSTKALFFYGTRLKEECEKDHDLGYVLMKRIAGVMLQRFQATRRQVLADGPALKTNGS